MKRRFIILHDAGSPAQDEIFKNMLKSNEIGWWHWFSGSWLVVTTSYLLDAVVLRDMTNEAYPGLYKLVIEHHGDPNDWAAFGLIPPNPDMFEWLRTQWAEEQANYLQS